MHSAPRRANLRQSVAGVSPARTRKAIAIATGNVTARLARGRAAECRPRRMPRCESCPCAIDRAAGRAEHNAGVALPALQVALARIDRLVKSPAVALDRNNLLKEARLPLDRHAAAARPATRARAAGRRMRSHRARIALRLRGRQRLTRAGHGADARWWRRWRRRCGARPRWMLGAVG